MKANLSLKSGVSFEVNTESGHSLLIDGSPDIGGQNLGARPMELVLVGLGGCTALDVIHILRKARQNVSDLKVQLNSQRADSIPKVFTDIEIEFIVIGEQINVSQVVRAIELSADKYCSVGKMLEKSVKIEHYFKILDTAGNETHPKTLVICHSTETVKN
jgi:putative redox protein